MPAVIESAAAITRAAVEAVRCARVNLEALGKTQPELAGRLRELPDLPDTTEFVFGRDGALTALIDGQWLDGCSIPLAAARRLLRSLELRSAAGCFINPTHAGQLSSALDQTTGQQAIFAAIPDLQTARMMLHCHDFSGDITGNRLWLAAGEDWPDMLREVLVRHPGLAVPGQFIRTALTSQDDLEQWMGQARRVFGEITQTRSELLAAAADAIARVPANTTAWCVVAGSKFRLWDGAARAILGCVQSAGPEIDIIRCDPDDPISASPAALAEAGMRAGGIIAADLGRGDFPSLMPTSKPWITWVTRGHLPSAAAAGPKDRLLLASEHWSRAALDAGWKEESISIAAWPRHSRPMPATEPSHLLLVADTRAVEASPGMNLSSHRLLWEAIHQELETEPLAVDGDMGAYLLDRRERMNISAEGFDAGRFVQELILPVYRQGLARMLRRAGLPLRLLGDGWGEIDEFRGIWEGSAQSHKGFLAAVEKARVLVHPSPAAEEGEIDSLGRPVLRPRERRPEAFIREARRLLREPFQPGKNTMPELTLVLLQLLPR